MKYVAYYRVSTQKQGQSGLGLEAQKAAVDSFVKCANCVIGEFVEIESGKKDNRTELAKALTLAKATGATLIVAKLDRLSRNIAFLTALMDSGVKILCVDMPEANEFTLHIFAAVAQNERKAISKRTKDALQAKKARGERLGAKGTENLQKGNAVKKSVEVRKAKAANNINTQRAADYAKALKQTGKTIREIVEILTEKKYLTAKGLTNWNIAQVQRLLK